MGNRNVDFLKGERREARKMTKNEDEMTKNENKTSYVIIAAIIILGILAALLCNLPARAITISNTNTNTDETIIFMEYIIKPEIYNPNNYTLTYAWKILDEEGALLTLTNASSQNVTFTPLSSGKHTTTLTVTNQSGDVYDSTIYFSPKTQQMDVRLVWFVEEEDIQIPLSIAKNRKLEGKLYLTNIGTDDSYPYTIKQWIEYNDKRITQIDTIEGRISISQNIPINITPSKYWKEGNHYLMLLILTENMQLTGLKKQFLVTEPIKTAEQIAQERGKLAERIGHGTLISMLVATVAYVYIRARSPREMFTLRQWKAIGIIFIVSLFFLLLFSA